MGRLKSVKTNVTYKVPAWNNCNGMSSNLGQPDGTLCRFCVKEGKGNYRCSLYNTPLAVSEGIMVDKTRDCVRATAGFKSVVEDVPDIDPAPVVDPALLIKSTIELYSKTRRNLLSQGYPEALADQVAQQYVLGGK